MLLAIVCLAVMFPVLASAQAKTFKGTVVDENGDPVIGATIMVKGTSIGTVTDFDGNYSITAEEGATLLVSFLGYSNQEVPAANNLKVVLEEDTLDLEDVVVVGYGIQKKSSVTGAVSQVKSEDMQARTITNANQALQGKTAGVQVFSSSAKPGASPSVRIRGISSNGDSSPLYVVDGRISNDIGGIDPNDIESIEVLKDGASAAIYGAAAGNGVILISTRKGKGDGKITYEYQLTTQSMAKVPEVMNAEQYIEYFTEPGFITLENFYKNWDFKTNTNWAKESFERSIMQRHNATFQAGTELGSMYVSLSYLNNNGMLAGDQDIYQRVTGMVNASWKVKRWLEISTNNQIEYYKTRSVGEGNEYGSPLLSVIQFDPLTPVCYEDDSKLPDHVVSLMNNNEYGEVLRDKNGHIYGLSPFITSNTTNPLVQRDASFSEYRGHNINGTTSLNFTPIEGLVATTRLSYRLSGGESYGVGQDYQASPNMGTPVVSLNAGASHPIYYQWENFLNYNRNFGDHNVGIMLGHSQSTSRSFDVNGSYTGSDDKGVKQDDPLFWYFSYATSSASKSLNGGEPLYNKKLAYFGRLNWDYQGKYMAQFSLRADAADLSVLPQPKRWGYFPAASAGWTISQESFMDNTKDWLDQLKIRVSWGQNGSTASLGGYSYATVIASTGSYWNGNSWEVGYAPSSTGNNQLKWETSQQTNFGVDARFLNNKISFSVDYFNKETKDLIVSGITPSTVVGNTASPVNAGNITNKGFEFEVGWQDKIGDLTYGVRGNLATLKNEVTYIHESLDAIDGATFHTYGAITRFEVGKPAWYFYGYKFAGINKETGDPLFYTKSGDITDNPTANDKTQIGKGMADFNYGITLTAAYKGFDAIVFGTGSVGNDIFCCLNRTDYYVNKLTALTDNRWKKTNTTEQNAKATNPRAGANGMDAYMTSDAMVYDGSFFKIKQIQLGYTIPKDLLKSLSIDNVRVYGSLEDFFTFTDYPGFDPEVTGVGNALGVDKGSYPNSRKVVFGVNVTF
ncbi:MAG: TonB-dependent receptor [Bacteroidales bacterium]|nr:TonB-dependent receptor [Bacteroidales bacterium]